MTTTVTKLFRHNFEYYLTTHCNLKCTHCSMHSPYLDEEYTQLDSLKKDLAVLSKHMRVGRLRLLGGEPTLHPLLLDFVKEFRKANFADVIELVTNGSTLHILSEELFRSIDRVHISRYDETGMNYHKMSKRLSEIKRDVNPKLGWKIEASTFGEFHIDQEVSEEVAQQHYDGCKLPKEWGCSGFKDGRLFKCSPSSIINKFYQQTGRTPPYDFYNEDSIPIHDPHFSAETLLQYILTSKALNACRVCRGSSYATPVVRKQMTPQEIKFVREIKFVKNNRNISSSS